MGDGSRKSLKQEGEFFFFPSDPRGPTEGREQRRENNYLYDSVVPRGSPPTTPPPGAMRAPGRRKWLFGWAYVCRVNTEGQVGTDAKGVKSG